MQEIMPYFRAGFLSTRAKPESLSVEELKEICSIHQRVLAYLKGRTDCQVLVKTMENELKVIRHTLNNQLHLQLLTEELEKCGSTKSTFHSCLPSSG